MLKNSVNEQNAIFFNFLVLVGSGAAGRGGEGGVEITHFQLI